MTSAKAEAPVQTLRVRVPAGTVALSPVATQPGVALLVRIAQQQQAARHLPAECDTIVFPKISEPGDAGLSPDEGPGRTTPASRLLPSPLQAAGWVRPGPVLLTGVLAVQAVFALRLVWSNTAFSDEALYLWGGHLEWAHLLHGEQLPAFPAYFSGAPILYPPLGALADSVGGLAGARILSLVFMLCATALLYLTASRVAGRRAGLFAAALWACLGPTLHLSAFATYDAAALCLMAVSVWCIVRAGENRDAAGWLFAGAAALALANATAYSSAIFDPVVVVVAFCVSAQRIRFAAFRATALGAYVAGLLVIAATAGGGLYFAGIAQTVLSRVSGDVPMPAVLLQAWQWSMPVVILAGVGVLFAVTTETGRRRRALLTVLACTALLVPIEQARIRTGTSLDKHVDYGAWFAAIAAGYGVSKMWDLASRATWCKIVAAWVSVLILLAPAATGFAQAKALFAAWPNATPFISVFAPVLARTQGPVLVETDPIAEYYLPQGHDWQRWSSTFAIMFLSGHGKGPGVGQIFGAKVYAPLIASRYWSLIALNYGSASVGLDKQLAAMLNHSPAYKQIGSVPYGSHFYEVWERIP